MRLGLVLFAIVVAGIYIFQKIGPESPNQIIPNALIPLVLFTGFFIFLVAAILFSYGLIKFLKN